MFWFRWTGIWLGLFFPWMVFSSPFHQHYSSSFSMDSRGVPVVSIGLFSGIRTIRWSVSDPVFSLQNDSFQQKGNAHSTFTTTVLESTPATIDYWLSPFVLPFSKRNLWEKKAASFSFLNKKLQPWISGTFFAVQGILVDNRNWVALFESFSSRKKAYEEARKWEKNKGISFQVVEKMKLYPQGKIRIASQNRSKTIHHSWFQIKGSKEIIREFTIHSINGKKIEKRYKGRIFFILGKDGLLSVVNRISLTYYLQGVLPSEMPSKAPMEALKAQAVCARNEILAKLGHRHQTDPFLFCSATHCQVFKGKKVHHYRTNQAIAKTRGLVLWKSNNQLADASYSAVCGGHTENNESVWTTFRDLSLRGKTDLLSFSSISPKQKEWYTHPPTAYCSGRTPYQKQNYRWSKEIEETSLRKRLIRLGVNLGRILRIEPVQRGVSGRILQLRLVGSKKTWLVVGELKIRKTLFHLKSSMFLVQKNQKKGFLSWTLVGGGWGHGVGLCQWGAIERARRGQTFKQILQHYYPKTRLVRLFSVRKAIDSTTQD